MGLLRRSRPAPGPGPHLSPTSGPADAGDGRTDTIATGPAPAPAPAPASALQRTAAPGGDRPAAWRSLPPLHPTLAPPGSTFKIGAAVKEDLVALESPRLSHGMGHLAGGDGPTGVVEGLATVAVQRHSDDDAAPSDDGPGGAPADGHAVSSADLPVVTRSHRPDGDGAGTAPAEPAADWRRGMLVPRIVDTQAAGEASPGHLVEAHTADALTRRLPLVTTPANVQRRTDAPGSRPPPPAGPLA